MVHLHKFMLVILAPTFCKLTILLPTKKCKLYKIADLDKIVAPQRRVKLFGYEASDLLMYIYRFSFIFLKFLSHRVP